MTTIPLRGEFIPLAQAVKAAGLADSGGQAKNMVREGLVVVNGAVEKQPAKKLRAGDRFRVGDAEECLITPPGPPDVDADDEDAHQEGGADA